MLKLIFALFAPGGIRISFSGSGVRGPDGRQLQRVGLQARPRDEVPEKAIDTLKK